MRPEIQHFDVYPIPRKVEYSYQPFPKWVDVPGTKNRVVVKDAEEYENVMGVPYVDEVPIEASPVSAAPAPTSASPSVSEDERAKLVEYALSTGIPIDRRWGIEKLKKAIASHNP